MFLILGFDYTHSPKSKKCSEPNEIQLVKWPSEAESVRWPSEAEAKSPNPNRWLSEAEAIVSYKVQKF